MEKDREFFESKMLRIKAEGCPSFKNNHVNDDEFSAAEKRLEVVFSENFKNWYRARNGRSPVRGYRILKIESMYTIEGYEANNPETFKAVAIAEDGLGDCIGMKLNPESDYKLLSILYEFSHETGKVSILLSKSTLIT